MAGMFGSLRDATCMGNGIHFISVLAAGKIADSNC
jgi:hypothetical protein